MRRLVTPDVLRQTVDRHTMPPRREKDLEHLLRSHSTEISRADCASRALDREWAEQSDDRPLTAFRDIAGASPLGHGTTRVYRTRVPLGRTTSHSPPNSLTF